MLVLLEDLGFCKKGEGGAFVQEGHLRRGGELPLNTDGGGLSSCHPGMRGIFLLIESVRQLRGQAGEAQVPDCEVALACGSGGWLSCIGAVILGKEPVMPRRGERHGVDAAAPAPDAVSAPFWEAAARGELLIQECPSCGHRQFYPRALCTACGADAEWLTRSGRGTVHTFTVIRQNRAKPFKDELPYVVAMIELDEGARMMGNVTGCDPDDVHIGMPVEVYFVEADEGVGVPFWRPRCGARTAEANKRAGGLCEQGLAVLDRSVGGRLDMLLRAANARARAYMPLPAPPGGGLPRPGIRMGCALIETFVKELRSSSHCSLSRRTATGTPPGRRSAKRLRRESGTAPVA